jgi:hypothetical protein
MAAQWKRPARLASAKRFQKALKIINDPARHFWLDGAAMKTGGKHFALPACTAGGFDGLIASLNQHGAGL